MFSPEIRSRVFSCTSSVQHSTGGSSHSYDQDNPKDIKIGTEEWILSVFPGGGIVYAENPIESTKIFPRNKKWVYQGVGYKIGNRNLVLFLRTSNDQLEIEIKIISFKNIKKWNI